MRRVLAPGLLALLVALAAAGGCGDDDAEPTGRGMARGAAAGTGETAGAPQGAGAGGEAFEAPTDPRSGHVRLDQAPDPQAEPESQQQSQDTPERDLSAELRQRVGDPSSCLAGLDELPGEVSLAVTATVSTTGVVTRSSVSGPVPEQARDCVNRRLSTARLPGPIEGAPRTVTTSVTLRRQSND